MKLGEDASIFLTHFFAWLNEHCQYAVLRSYEGLPESYKSRDIDFAIEKSEYKKVKKDMLSLVEHEGWRVITIFKSYRLITWVVGSISDNIQCNVIQMDFFLNNSAYGINLLSAKEIVASRIFNGKIYHVNKEYEFLDKYLYNRALGANYPEKYADIRHCVENNSFVLQTLQQVFGCKYISECDTHNSKRLLLQAFKHNTISSCFSIPIFLFYRLLNSFRKTCFSVGFTGPDGSGKTTVIDLMITSLGDVYSKSHTYFHFRPMLFGNLGDVAHNAGLKKDVDHNYNQPHRGNKTNTLSSLVRLAYYATDYIIGYFVKVKPKIGYLRNLAIFDRYYTDIICDSRRSRIYLPTAFLYWFGRFFIPSLDYNILLTASTDAIMARKQELDREGIEAINEKIDYLATKPGYYKIMNDGTPKEAVAKILHIIFDKQHQRNKKRI